MKRLAVLGAVGVEGGGGGGRVFFGVDHPRSCSASASSAQVNWAAREAVVVKRVIGIVAFVYSDLRIYGVK